MAQHLVSLTTSQERALRRTIKLAGRGSIVSEIRKAIRQHLAGPRYIEAAFAKLLEQNAPKDLPALLAQMKKNKIQIKRDLREIKRIREQPSSLPRVNQSQLSGLANMALVSLGSAKKANSWFYRPNKFLKDRTPFSVLSTPAGVKRVTEVLNQQSRVGQKERAVIRKAAQRPSRNMIEQKVAVRHTEDPPMSGVMALYAQVAAKWGKVDPKDGPAVARFFENILPTLKPKIQQAIVDEIFYKSMAVPTCAGCGQEEE